jgi:hypothetical protein
MNLQYAPGSYRACSGRSNGIGYFDNDEWWRLKPANPPEFRGVLHTVGDTGVNSPPFGLTHESFGTVVDGQSHTLMLGEYHTKTRNNARTGWPTDRSRLTFWAYTYTSYNQSSIFTQGWIYVPDYAECDRRSRILALGGDPARWPHACKRAFASLHPGGMQFALVDASGHGVSPTADVFVLANMASIAGGEPTAFRN